MRNNWQHALVAFLLALVAWYFVSGRERVDVWVQASVQFSGMPENMIIRDGLLKNINVRIRGPKGLIHGIDQRSLVYLLDLGKMKQGLNVYALQPDKFPLPRTFEVMEINPSRVEIVVDRIASKQVPVKPIWQGTLDPDYQLMEVVTEPRAVVIQGPEKIVNEIQQVETQLISLPSTTPGTLEEVAPLNLPPEIEADLGFVEVRLLFGVKTKAFHFELPLTVDNRTPYQVTVQPDKIEAEAEIPLPVVRQGAVEEAVTARVQAEEFLGPGVYARSPRIILPPGGRLLTVTPEHVEVTVHDEPRE